jgi:hypothetical protein
VAPAVVALAGRAVDATVQTYSFVSLRFLSGKLTSMAGIPPLGELFPVGGRLAPSQMIGRQGDVVDLVQRLREFQHIVLSGERRIGKTTVCGAACAELQERHGFIVVELEAPEQSSAQGLCQMLVDRTSRLDLDWLSKGLLEAAVPFVQGLLEAQGIPLDLSEFRAGVPSATIRTVLELPRAIARRHGRPVVLFIDELQHAVDYADGVELITGLVDIYAGGSEVAVLIDGSNDRTIEQLMGDPYSVAKLAQRLALAETIPPDQWRRPLRERFAEARLAISDSQLQELIDFGTGRPYRTMAACSGVAIAARRLEISEIDGFAMRAGLQETEVRLADDE